MHLDVQAILIAYLEYDIDDNTAPWTKKYEIPRKARIMRLDKTAFRMSKHNDKANKRKYWLDKTPEKRLAAAWYLICCAYDIPYQSDHKVDRTVFRIVKRK